ncbi:MAG: helix-turn-helix transcriptional regulator [Candidatus Methanomethylophilaceae archaeon]|nr:helix-turn-helix transcriptional regulator [Candidatus Methanomethylophilaceae archaeon]
MAISIRLDRMLVERKMTLVELSKRVGATPVNLSKLKAGKVSGVRFSTLDAICEALDCQPGDIIVYSKEDPQNPDLMPSAIEETSSSDMATVGKKTGKSYKDASNPSSS